VTEFDIIAREVSGYRTRFEVIERRLGEIDKVIARLEAAALTTARALQEISRHWDALYEAMQRTEESEMGQLGGLGDGQPDRKNPPVVGAREEALTSAEQRRGIPKTPRLI